MGYQVHVRLFVLLICLITEGAGPKSRGAAGLWRIVDSAERVEVGLLKDVKIERFPPKDKRSYSSVNLADLFCGGDHGAPTVIWKFLPIEHCELRSVRLQDRQAVYVSLDQAEVAVCRLNVTPHVPSQMQGSGHPVIMEPKTPLNRKTRLEGLDGGFYGVDSDPSPLAHLKVSGVDLISSHRSVPLATVNNHGIYTDTESHQLDRRLPKWCLIWLAGLAFGVALWGWYNLRNERRITMGFWAFILGKFGWGFALSGILHVFF